MPTPELSVVIAAQGDAAETARCLDSLMAQRGIDPSQMQIIAVEPQPAPGAAQLQQRFPSVQFLSSPILSLPRLHGIGIEAATGALIALTEGHCTFAQDWAATAIATHEKQSELVVGGAVEPGSALDRLNLGLFLCDYAQFVSLPKQAWTHDLPGNNVVFKRAALAPKNDLSRSGFWKTFYCRTLEEQGHQLLSQPAMRVLYNRHLTLKELFQRRYNHGRCFGGMRAASITPARRLMHFLLGPAVPALIAWKVASRCRENQQCTSMLLRSWPAALLSITIWCTGEWIGNICGSGTCCDYL